MECMCPNCGKKIESGNLAFDLTSFLQEIIKEIIGETNKQLQDGCDIYFNHWKNQKHFVLLSEKELWNGQHVYSGSDLKKEKSVSFFIPVKMILEKIKKDDCPDGDDESKTDFVSWLSANKEIGKKEYVLRLIKHEDGDIWFDEIQYENQVVSTKRLCSHCTSEMSYYAGRYPEWTLTVLGGPRVSKSTALTSCVAAFMDENDPMIRFSIHPNDAGVDFFKERYLKEYKAGRKLKATETQEDKIPRLSFKVTIGKKDAKKKKHICLTFVDLPGEFNDENGISEELKRRYRNIFENIDFVWYCTDPGEIQQLQGEVVRNELGYEGKQIIETDRIKYNMGQLSSYFAHSNRKVPVAYILGKTDSMAVSPDDRKKYGLYSEKTRETTLPFEVRAFFRRSEKVRQYMMSKNTGGLVEEFESMFPERCYIASSAYGYNPKEVEETETREKKPYHCKEAFYWMLALRNCIDVRVEYRTSGFLGMGSKTHEIECKLTELEDDIRKKAYKNLYMSGSYTI